jgi:hypothetical protein
LAVIIASKFWKKKPKGGKEKYVVFFTLFRLAQRLTGYISRKIVQQPRERAEKENYVRVAGSVETWIPGRFESHFLLWCIIVFRTFLRPSCQT